MIREVRLIADGSCLRNPGPGGWACILRSGTEECELSGSEARTTNNRMELRAVIEGLRALDEPSRVVAVTDSQYVQRGMTDLIAGWKASGWCTRAGAPVANRDLWEELDSLAQDHSIDWIWVRGHGADPEQIRCDELATAAARLAASSAKK